VALLRNFEAWKLKPWKLAYRRDLISVVVIVLGALLGSWAWSCVKARKLGLRAVSKKALLKMANAREFVHSLSLDLVWGIRQRLNTALLKCWYRTKAEGFVLGLDVTVAVLSGVEFRKLLHSWDLALGINQRWNTALPRIWY